MLFLNANNAILKLQMSFFLKHNCHKTKEIFIETRSTSISLNGWGNKSTTVN